MTFLELARLEYLYEERAGIKEFEGNQPRPVAEASACLEVYGTACPHNPRHTEPRLL